MSEFDILRMNAPFIHRKHFKIKRTNTLQAGDVNAVLKRIRPTLMVSIYSTL